MIDILAIPADVRSLYVDAPNGDDVRRQIAWLREKVRPTALTEAFLFVAGADGVDTPPYTETLLIIRSMSKRLGWSDDTTHAALMAEWPMAVAKSREAMFRLNKRVRDLAFARNTGEIIVSAARLILEEAGISIPSDAILAECRRIAFSTVPGHARRAAR